MKQLVLDFAPPPAPTLESFVPGRNQELVAALDALANCAGKERFIYLWGADGSGRSHLLRAVAAAARRDGRRTAWFDADTATFDASDDAVCSVDDVHLFGAAAQIALFGLHNRIRAGTGALIVSGDTAPAQLRLRADLATRLASGLVYHVHGLNDEEKSVALRDHANARGFKLPQDVTDYLLRHARRDMPTLLTVLDALDRYSLETRRTITVPLLRELLEANQGVAIESRAFRPR